jgi:NAD(P)-dependent dehydrogenase (short-subunit alcohol dehydrogenase family)
MDRRFEDRVAIVTGSSSGIGKATALRLAGEGAAVCVVADRNVDGGQATVKEIRDSGGEAIFVQANVARSADCQRICDETLRSFGRVDVLVNNAGVTRVRPLEQIDEAVWETVIDVNLKSAYLMSRLAVADMLKRNRGSIVNVSSVHAVMTSAGGFAYAAAKAGICGLTRAAGVAYGAKGIRVNCILPGTIDTSLYPRTNAEVDRSGWRPRANEAQVLKRNGSPEEIAVAIAFLASDDASFINAAVLIADGGLLSLLKDY